MYKSPYGKAEGLADRLDGLADRLAKDKTFPWLGSGIYDDLRAAACAVRGEPIQEKSTPVPEPEAWETEFTKKMEFDL